MGVCGGAGGGIVPGIVAPQDKDFVDPALVAAWRRMLWLVRGSADVVEALVPVAAGMTKDEISRLLARAGAPSGKGVEPVEQVLGLLGVVPRGRYEALLKNYEELARRVEGAEQSIERVRRQLREQGLVDEAEQLVDSWGGLVRRTLRAQAGFMRTIANASGTRPPEEAPAPAPALEAPEPEPRPAPTNGAARKKPVTQKAPAPPKRVNAKVSAAPKPAATKKPATARAATTKKPATTRKPAARKPAAKKTAPSEETPKTD